MTAFSLKIVACISMFLCHIPFVYSDTLIPLFYIGRLAFPIYGFLISEGYAHTKDVKKYLTRLIVFAVISQIPAYLLFVGTTFEKLYFNVFFTLSTGLISIMAYEKINNKIISFPIVFILAIIAEKLRFDYGAIGILIIFTFHLFRNNKIKMTLAEIFLMILFYIEKSTHFAFTISNVQFLLINLMFMISSLLFISAYNGKKGKSSKYIQLGFYLFYPAHLILLIILKTFT